MGETTEIAWADKTWSPVIGCEKRHTGCANCYAEKYGLRFGVRWGPNGKRRRTSAGYWKKPLAWARKAAQDGKKIRVFPSLCDPLDPKIPADTFSEWMELIRKTHRLFSPSDTLSGGLGFSNGGIDWLLLTKLPERWHIIPADVRPLVWLGTSVSDQATADEWIPRLLGAHGFALRFLSVEPLVGPVDLERWLWMAGASSAGPFVDGLGRRRGGGGCGGQTLTCMPTRDIGWVIIGGESGHKARPCDVAWIRAIVGQCRAAGVPSFVKQLGARPVQSMAAGLSHLRGADASRAVGYLPGASREALRPLELGLRDSHGGDPSEWPEDLRVREFPEVSRG